MLNEDMILDSTSQTLRDFSNSLSPGFGDSLKGVLIGNIVTEQLKQHPTPLQIALGVLLRGRKRYIKYTMQCGWTT